MTDSSNLLHTRNYIRLFQMQLHGVLEDMAKPAESLSDQFSESLLKLYDIKENISEDSLADRDLLLEKVQALIDDMFECVSNMQFLDAKRQRIEHVADGLSYLVENDDCESSTKYSWDEINNMIIDQYKMETERNIYEAYLQRYDTQGIYKLINEAN